MQGKYYLTVDDCILKAWRKANEGDLTWLRIDRSKGSEKEDREAWALLYADFIKVIGLADDFKEYLDLLAEKMQLQFDYLESEKNGIRDRFLLNRIKILDLEIKKFHDSAGNGMTMKQVLWHLSKAQGFQIKETEITVVDYFTLLKDFNNG